MLTYAVADASRGRSPPPPNHPSRDGTAFELLTLVLVAYVTVQPARVFVRKRQQTSADGTAFEGVTVLLVAYVTVQPEICSFFSSAARPTRSY
jgi:hypothetical protein